MRTKLAYTELSRNEKTNPATKINFALNFNYKTSRKTVISQTAEIASMYIRDTHAHARTDARPHTHTHAHTHTHTHTQTRCDPIPITHHCRQISPKIFFFFPQLPTSFYAAAHPDTRAHMHARRLAHVPVAASRPANALYISVLI